MDARYHAAIAAEAAYDNARRRELQGRADESRHQSDLIEEQDRALADFSAALRELTAEQIRQGQREGRSWWRHDR